MSRPLYTYKITMTVTSDNPSWIEVKHDINVCMYCGIVNELTSIKKATYIKPISKRHVVTKRKKV